MPTSNNVPTTTGLPPSTELAFQQILAREHGYGEVDPSPQEQEKYLRGYSFSSLVYNFIYFQAMHDSPLMITSLIVTILVFPSPILLILPFWARRRAWQMRKWESFNHFKLVQQKWDRAGVYGVVASLAIFYLIVRLGISFLNQGSLNGVDPSTLLNQYRSLLGN